MLLAAFDPGATTGWCLTEYDADQLDQPPVVLRSGQFGEWAGVRGILAPAESAFPGLVVVESFRPFPSTAQALVGDTLIAAQVIGAIRQTADQTGAQVVMQSPASKMFWTNARLREYGYIPTWVAESSLHSGRHALDAIRHSLHYLHFGLHIRVKPLSTVATHT
jgi:hypothetical protein